MAIVVSDIPTRMAHRPRDQRGYPIPFSQFVDDAGTPDFRTLDDGRTMQCLQRRLCSLCGEPMGRHIFFVGGPKCVEHGLFYDPPMHRDCAIFAIQTCPHLARAKGRYADPAPRIFKPGYKHVVGDMDTDKAEWFGLMHGERFTFGRQPNGMITIHAKLPWLEVERWRDGAPMESQA
jgi:hypothetical protein